MYDICTYIGVVWVVNVGICIFQDGAWDCMGLGPLMEDR